MRGISMSRVSTSGCRVLIFSRATKGSAAVPATLISGSEMRIWVSNWRISAESSTMRTLIGSGIADTCCQKRTGSSTANLSVGPVLK